MRGCRPGRARRAALPSAATRFPPPRGRHLRSPRTRRPTPGSRQAAAPEKHSRHAPRQGPPAAAALCRAGAAGGKARRGGRYASVNGRWVGGVRWVMAAGRLPLGAVVAGRVVPPVAPPRASLRKRNVGSDRQGALKAPRSARQTFVGGGCAVFCS